MEKCRLQNRMNSIGDQPSGNKSVYADRGNNFFTGIVIGLPLSILSWVGIFYLVSVTQKTIF